MKRTTLKLIAFGLIAITSVFARFTAAQELVGLKKVNLFGGGYHKGFFSPDGRNLALLDDKIKIVNLQTGKEICRAEFSTKALFFSAAFSPNGKTLAASYDEEYSNGNSATVKITLFDSVSCKIIKSLVTYDSYKDIGSYISFSNDGQLLTSVINASQIWQTKDGRKIYQTLFPEGYDAKRNFISPDGHWLAAYAETFQVPNTFGKLVITDLQTNQQKDLDAEIIKAFRFSADSSLLATVNAVLGKSGWAESAKVKIYSTSDWLIKQEFQVPGKWNGAFDISSGNQLLAIGGFGKFRIYSLQTGKLLTEEYHYKRTRKADSAGAPDLVSFINHIEFSPDGKWLSTGGDIGYVKLWKLDVSK